MQKSVSIAFPVHSSPVLISSRFQGAQRTRPCPRLDGIGDFGETIPNFLTYSKVQLASLFIFSSVAHSKLLKAFRKMKYVRLDHLLPVNLLMYQCVQCVLYIFEPRKCIILPSHKKYKKNCDFRMILELHMTSYLWKISCFECFLSRNMFFFIIRIISEPSNNWRPSNN